EGYWVSGYLLHNTELSRSFASENSKGPKVQLLRLKNVVNGFADTSYRIHGDTLQYRVGIRRYFMEDRLIEEEEFYPFRILFHSKDRLVLMDDVTHEETTFYNLLLVPVKPDAFNEITFEGKELIINDSITSYGSMGCTDEIYLLLKMLTNVTWKNSLDTIVSRIDWRNAIFVRESTNRMSQIGKWDSDSLIIEMLIPVPGSYMQITTPKHLGSWHFSSQNLSDPALSVLFSELLTFRAYCYKHNLFYMIRKI
ncbi:MAG: hypothetical protein M3R17_07205, partial [Bacteroidota bacterium]|nr:hypothetical protein [Bacteroidota bacterium]